MKTDFYQTAAEIDRALNIETSIEQMEKTLLTISKDISYENYFFKKVFGFKWFYLLKEKGYFSPNRAPSPKQVKQENYFIIPRWNVLDYLERVSQQVTIVGSEEYAEEFLEIIRNVTRYHIDHDRISDNYRTWRYFVKILSSIPNDTIIKYSRREGIDIARDWVKEWISSKFNNLIPAADILEELIPKFLTNNKEDAIIAQNIVDVVTDIKWIPLDEEQKRIHISKKEEEPQLIVDSYCLIDSFIKHNNAARIGELCDASIIYILADKLTELLKRENNSQHQIDIKFGTETYCIRVTRQTDGNGNLRDFDFKVFVGKFKEEDLEKDKSKNSFLRLVACEPEPIYNFGIEDCRDRKMFLALVKRELRTENTHVDLTGAEDINERLGYLYMGLFNDYSYIWLKSLDSPNLSASINEANDVITIILKDILAAKCTLDTKAGRNILSDFLGEKYQFPLFNRLVLFIVKNNWSEYQDLFWRFLNDNPGAFSKSDYEVEIYRLLEKNIDNLKPEDRKRLERIIIEGPRLVPDEKQEQYRAYWKQKWYSAMRKDSHFLKLYKEQKTITEIEEIEPPDEEVTVHRGEKPSSLSKEDILRMSNMDLIKSLNELRAKDKRNGPPEEGLAEILRSAVKDNPVKFVDGLDSVTEAHYLYAYSIFRGLEDAWKEKKSFNWGKLLDFEKRYIDEPNFWKDAQEVQGKDWSVAHVWIFDAIADLIREGTRDDSWAFAEDYLNAAEEILDNLMDRLPVKQDADHKDAVTVALNTSYGKVISALILLSLRRARIEDRKGIKRDIGWDPARYNALFKKGVIEAFTLFGQYLPNLAYLNKSWVKQKIKELESESFPVIDIRWQSFIQGYLSVGRIYPNLYELMHNHYLRIMGADFKKEHTEERLVQHICIGYLRGIEDIDNKESLFRRIIDKWDSSDIEMIIGCFWMQRDYLVESIQGKIKAKKTLEIENLKKRIIDFWKWVFENKYKNNDPSSDEDKKILSDLTKLTVFLSEIDSENFNWLMVSAPYVDVRFNTSFLIEYLNKLKDVGNSHRYVGKIFLEMLKNSTPDYREEDIYSIVKFLYDRRTKEQVEQAKEIRNIYGSQGYDFLRTIREETIP